MTDDAELVGLIGQRMQAASTLFAAAAGDAALHATLAGVAGLTVRSLRGGGRLFICGNGGSAAEATHFAGEMVGPFHNRLRPAFAAIPLGFDPASLTAASNDFGFEHAFARQLEGLGREGDILWVLSTSGQSANILAVMKQARGMGIPTVLFTDAQGGPAADLADHILHTPQAPTPRVQELHLLYGHCLCEMIERALAT